MTKMELLGIESLTIEQRILSLFSEVRDKLNIEYIEKQFNVNLKEFNNIHEIMTYNPMLLFSLVVGEENAELARSDYESFLQKASLAGIECAPIIVMWFLTEVY